jgi:hypothetical protein
MDERLVIVDRDGSGLVRAPAGAGIQPAGRLPITRG